PVLDRRAVVGEHVLGDNFRPGRGGVLGQRGSGAVLRLPGGHRRRDGQDRGAHQARCHSPERPPDLRSSVTEVISAPRSTPLTMSYTVSAATEAAVSASI